MTRDKVKVLWEGREALRSYGYWKNTDETQPSEIPEARLVRLNGRLAYQTMRQPHTSQERIQRLERAGRVPAKSKWITEYTKIRKVGDDWFGHSSQLGEIPLASPKRNKDFCDILDRVRAEEVESLILG